VKRGRVDVAIEIMLVVAGLALCAICALTYCGPALGSQAGCIQSLLFERKWLSRNEFTLASFPATAYEVAPGNAEWGDATAEYYFSSGSSTGVQLHTRFSSPEDGQLASMTLITGYGSITYAHPTLGDKTYSVEPDEPCGPVDIAWAKKEGQCTCSIDGGACLTWWTDEGGYVIVSKLMDSGTLEQFVNSLVPVKR
jgi:hypothetical protein